MVRFVRFKSWTSSTYGKLSESDRGVRSDRKFRTKPTSFQTLEFATRLLISCSFVLLSCLALYSFTQSSLFRGVIVPGIGATLTASGAETRDRLARRARVGNFSLNPAEEQFIRQSLKAKPLQASLVSSIAGDLAMEGKVLGADHLFRIAGTVSRRDAMSQVYALEKASDAGDVAGAVRQYNRLMSVHRELQPMLLNVLVPALQFTEVRDELRPYLLADPSWGPKFFDVATDAGDPLTIVELVAPIGNEVGGFKAAHSRILYRLAAAGMRKEFNRYASSLFPRYNPVSFAAFSPNPSNISPFFGELSWQFGDESGVDAYLTERNQIKAHLSLSYQGAIARRDVNVDPASPYKFSLLSEASETLTGDLRVDAKCATRSVGSAVFYQERVERINSINILLRSPADCRLIKFTISFIADGNSVEENLVIKTLSLDRY